MDFWIGLGVLVFIVSLTITAVVLSYEIAGYLKYVANR